VDSRSNPLSCLQHRRRQAWHQYGGGAIDGVPAVHLICKTGWVLKHVGSVRGAFPERFEHIPLYRCCVDTEKPTTPRAKGGLPPRCAPQNVLKTYSCQILVTPRQDPQARLVVTGSPQVVTENQDLLVLPPIPRGIFDDHTSLFNAANSPLTEPETSYDNAKRRNLGLMGILESVNSLLCTSRIQNVRNRNYEGAIPQRLVNASTVA
jgi:hypothetical protein